MNGVKIEKTILVVDDDPDILDAVQILLESEGFKVLTSTKGIDVDAISIQQMPDLILLDVLLSGYDGRKIAKKLKMQNITKNIPVVMMSAHPTARNDIKEYLADDFISKPFDIDYLMNKIHLYLH